MITATAASAESSPVEDHLRIGGAGPAPLLCEGHEVTVDLALEANNQPMVTTSLPAHLVTTRSTPVRGTTSCAVEPVTTRSTAEAVRSLPGSGGRRELDGAPGVDLIFGDEGDDELDGNGGEDWLDGGPGTDELVG
ncbi:MAG: hypothetical protein R2710_27930 [Acidimicrobiales bacterium]